MTSVCLYQCNFGDLDHMEISESHVKQTYPYDFVYYTTDEENLFPLDQPRPFHLARWPWCVMAKAYRIFPNKCKKLEGYDIVIHLDAQDQIINENFIKDVVESDIYDYNLMVSVHGDRNCPYQELEHVSRIAKYKENGNSPGVYFGGSHPIWSRVDKYTAEGMPKHLGLYWDGFLAYNMNKFSTELAETWWNEICETKGTWPCSQASLIYSLWKNNIKPKVIPREYGWHHYFNVKNHKR